ncbi:archaemetzincin [Candidatus Riflebacteria bacterium]
MKSENQKEEKIPSSRIKAFFANPVTRNLFRITLFLLIVIIGLNFALKNYFHVREFKIPTAAERIEAIGKIPSGQGALPRAFIPGDDFIPMGKPGAADWLSANPEAGQTFKQYLNGSYNKVTAKKNKLYFLPLGDFKPEEKKYLELVAKFCTFFFQMEVKKLPKIKIPREKFTHRKNGNITQILSGDILKFLIPRLPADAYFLVAITMTDLYSSPEMNFVFGEAALFDRTGAYSFFRTMGKRFNKSTVKDFRRGCHIMAHEACHMFGLYHCIYFKCLVNGANSRQEMDRTPLMLCPVCLRKLYNNIGFDILKRYKELADFFQKHGFTTEYSWTKKRLKKVVGARNSG